MKPYKLGFCPWGLLAVALVMLPNLLYLFFTPPNDALAGNSAAFWLWDVLENVGRFGVMLALVFVVRRTRPARPRALLWVAGGALLGYYALWAAYFAGAVWGVGLVGMAVLPTLFFVLVALWLGNAVAVGFGVLFGAVHIGVTATNFLL